MNCPICNAPMEPSSIQNKIYQQENMYCPSCDSYHIAEQIDDKEYYENEYHQNFNYKQSAIQRFAAKNFPFLAYRASSRYDYLNKKIKIEKQASFIEIGGGSGENYQVFDKKNKAKKYLVIEPGDAFIQNSENLEHIADIFENVPQERLGSAKVVMMFHVLEHIFDLHAFAEKLKAVDFEYFYIEVPNIANQLAKKDSMEDNPHYHHFSAQSLKKFAEIAGLKVHCIEGIAPRSYHPFNSIGNAKKYFLRAFHLNERYGVKDGMYLRAIFTKNIT